MRTLYLVGAGFVAWSLLLLARGPKPGAVFSHPPLRAVTAASEAAAWFLEMKPYCNAVEVETRHRWMPPPAGLRGSAYSAACFALAGRTDRAREIIETLDGGDRWKAAGVVFDVGHPVADAGDDLSAGPIMELVVEFWPNHYMALYHAGAARFELGELARARAYLERFLEEYERDDGWRTEARRMLDEIVAR